MIAIDQNYEHTKRYRAAILHAIRRRERQKAHRKQVAYTVLWFAVAAVCIALTVGP